MIDDAAGDRETQAGAAGTAVPPAHERFEQLPDEVLGHTVPVVLDRDDRVAAARGTPSATPRFGRSDRHW